MPSKKSKESKAPDGVDTTGYDHFNPGTPYTAGTNFNVLWDRPSLDRGLSEIRDIMKREGLTLCLILDDKIYYILPGGNQL